MRAYCLGGLVENLPTNKPTKKGSTVTPEKMTMFKHYKRVLNRFSNYTFSLNVTPDGYLLIRPNPDDPDVPFVQRISAVQTQALLDNSEPA